MEQIIAKFPALSIDVKRNIRLPISFRRDSLYVSPKVQNHPSYASAPC
jgi:hypothetical protein